MGLRVLVVEDNALAAEGTLAVLRAGGHQAASVSSGEQALACHAAGAWDVVIADLALPGMDGWQLLERLLEREPGLPVLVVTGEAVEPSDAPCAGRARRLLLKPVDPEELLAELALLPVPASGA